MRKILFSLLTLFLVMQLSADVVMHLKMPRSSYMLYEQIFSELTLRNTFGQVIIFGKEAEFQGKLEVELTDMHDRPLPGSGTKINLQGLILRPGADQKIRVNISKWMNMRRTGFFKIKFFISHPMLKNEYQSNAVRFDISHGKVLWTRAFGVPKMLGDQQSDEIFMRNYTLRALRDRDDIKLFLFVEDEKNIYAIKNIGSLLGNSSPQCNIDALNQLHILHPVSGKIFFYYVFDWNGKREVLKTYRTTDTIPVLFRNPANGEVKVVGGEVDSMNTDYAAKRLLPENLPVTAGENKK